MHAGLIQVVYTSVSSHKENASKQRKKGVLDGRLESLLAQNFVETLKTSNETKKKKLEIPKKGLPKTL
jgi:hypothetical protein